MRLSIGRLSVERKIKLIRELFGEDVRVFVETKDGVGKLTGVERLRVSELPQPSFDAVDLGDASLRRPNYLG